MFFLRKFFFQLKLYAGRYWKQILLAGVVFSAIGFILMIFESFLSSDTSAMWNQTLRNEDSRLLKSHFSNAKDHPFGFNDYSYPENKTHPCFRLIILGDSVVFGDGLPLEQIWSHKLEKKMKQRYPVEVLHWGQCGWSTLDQLEFLKQNFSDKKNIFDADLLLISWFDNDPDMGNINFDAYNSLLSNPFFTMFTWFFPKIGAIFFEFNEFRVYNHIRHQLYSDKNLLHYQNVLKELKIFCQLKRIDLFLVLISYGDIFSKIELAKIENLLQKECIPYINLHSFVAEQTQGLPIRCLFASPVNSHPGPVLTTLYARYTLPELIKRYGKKMIEKGGSIE